MLFARMILICFINVINIRRFIVIASNKQFKSRIYSLIMSFDILHVFLWIFNFYRSHFGFSAFRCFTALLLRSLFAWHWLIDCADAVLYSGVWGLWAIESFVTKWSAGWFGLGKFARWGRHNGNSAQAAAELQCHPASYSQGGGCK